MHKIAIDVGGTHTDAIAADDKGKIFIAKAETTPDDLTVGVLNSCEKIAAQRNESLKDFLSQTEVFLHGTTVGTNAVIQGKGPKIGCLTTKGFRDIVELRRGARETLYNLKVDYPPLLSPRYLRAEVSERTAHTGEVLEPLDENSVREAVRSLKTMGAESLAVTFLFSFLNPAHESRAREIIQEEWPEVSVSLSSEVLPRIEEFERFSTTLLDAFVAPSTAGYIKKLQERLRTSGFAGRLLIGQANGSVVTPEVILQRPIWTLSSGPAASAPAALFYGGVFDSRNIISVDMGGTSFDVLLIIDNEIQVTTEEWIGPHRLAIPMVKVRSIGAGGGSVAWVDPSGVLRVGPQSAGAVPGPACYGKGGEEPTVTDADLALGYINPKNFLGGDRVLDVARAEKALQEKVGSPLGLGVKEAASGVLTVLVHGASEAIRRECLDRGEDPRDFLILAGGGAGPTHAVLVAEELGISRVVIPNLAPAYCAFGWLRSDMTLDFIRSKVMASGQLDLKLLNSIYEDMEEEARRILGNGKVKLSRALDARYYSQFRETEVEVPTGTLGPKEFEQVVEAFHQRHERLFHFKVPGMELELIHYRVKASLQLDKPEPQPGSGPVHSVEQARSGQRQCQFGKKQVPTEVYEGAKLSQGNRIKGPAIIEERLTTVVVPPNFVCTVDPLRNYLIEKES